MAKKKYISLERLTDYDALIKAEIDERIDENKTVVDSSLSSTSTNPVQNKVIDAEFEAISEALNVYEKALDDHNHDDDYDTKGSASAVQVNLDTVSGALNTHTENSNIHVTTTNKSQWGTAYAHSQVAHARNDATKVADSTTNGNILINETETNVYTHPNSNVTTGTYKSVTVNAQGHVTGGSNPTTLAGYGITDAESKGAANTALNSAKTYTDTHNTSSSAHSDIRELITNLTTRLNTLANSTDEDLDQMAEIVAYIKSNKSLIDSITTSKINVSDIVDNLTTSSTSKVLSAKQGVAIKTLIDTLQANLDDHGHAIADVSGLQTALDGKAASSHGTHVSYSTTAPVMDGTAAVGTASTVARSDHKHPTDTSRASKTEFDEHDTNTTKHITSTERTNWGTAYTHSQAAHAPSNAEKNQNAFSNIKVGSTTVAADTVTDTVTFVGNNVTITPDATNDKITFAVADGSTSAKGIVQLTDSTSSTSTTTAATPNSVKSAYDLANNAKTSADTAQKRADSAYNLADGLTGVYVQDTEPTDAVDGDIWVDTAHDPSFIAPNLPAVTTADNGKVLMVVNGRWQAVDLSLYIDANGVVSM